MCLLKTNKKGGRATHRGMLGTQLIRKTTRMMWWLTSNIHQKRNEEHELEMLRFRLGLDSAVY